MKTLRDYQQKANNEIAYKYKQGIRKLIFQLPTGGGKTITASDLIFRFMKFTKKNILFIVHREELLNQFRKAFYGQYGIAPEPITAGVKYRNPNSHVYVTMVETANNRLRKNPRWFGDVGMVVIDEAHLGNFSKMHDYFKDEGTLIVGLTATPISASKNKPLSGLYQDIVCSTDIEDLIAIKSLVPNKTIHIKGSVKKETLIMKRGEFDNKQMGEEFSKFKHIKNCVDGYEKHGKGRKTLIFNCNIEHSKKVNEAFLEAGYNSRHLDGSMSEEERINTLQWFKVTPDAILNNIGILTAGFDEPTVEIVIMNRSTLSLPLWIQCTGRGSRPHKGKDHFVIIDLGSNALQHGDWSTPRDWKQIFFNPPKPSKGDGVAPIKICINEDCEAVISAGCNICKFCGAEQPIKAAAYDPESVEFELLVNNVNVKHYLEDTERLGYNPYSALHHIKETIISSIKKEEINEISAYNLLELYQNKVAEWCKLNNKNYDTWHKRTSSEWFFEELKKQTNFTVPKLNLAI